jgi:hypothetical protein
VKDINTDEEFDGDAKTDDDDSIETHDRLIIEDINATIENDLHWH